MTPLEIRDDQTGNMIGYADDSAEAATMLRELVAAFGNAYATVISFVLRDEAGQAESVRSGAEILADFEATTHRASAD